MKMLFKTFWFKLNPIYDPSFHQGGHRSFINFFKSAENYIKRFYPCFILTSVKHFLVNFNHYWGKFELSTPGGAGSFFNCHFRFSWGWFTLERKFWKITATLLKWNLQWPNQGCSNKINKNQGLWKNYQKMKSDPLRGHMTWICCLLTGIVKSLEIFSLGIWWKADL